MTYSLDDFFLEFNTPFTIAHGTRLGTDIVILKIAHQNITAFGEASLPPYLNEDAHSVKRFVKSFFELHSDLCVDLKESLLKLHTHEPENFSAKACIDIALHNWFAASAGIPVWKLIGLNKNPLPFCTFTIGIDSENVIRKKIEEAEDFKILKVKMGVPDEKDFLKTIRKYTTKPVCVDANQGWKNKKEALEMLLWLEQLNVVFVEQPMPKENIIGQQWLFERSPLPLYADESVQTTSDIHNIKDCFNGINIKLMKCGGISEALKMIATAREHQLQVMLGSMSETGCAINAAAQLATLADWCDLDGPMLTKNDPFNIVQYRDGKIIPV